ncbi:hypothetical protein [Puniceicoccus vermicola]|uniref:Uncharacterized protein n=1 Tax=Puniceicoccus vermicola TaxID=388746 RepID=A0A7X1AVJ7_9BACT|nr:hypothetical protein [Puniceicoccus vermicola]MBC2600788.1 hypothetical protein [Puniceicoccus vermicola]
MSTKSSTGCQPVSSPLAINNGKLRFDVGATVNPGGDGIIIFVGIAPPPPLQF